MKRPLLIGILCLAPSLAFAAGEHEHKNHHAASPIGVAGHANAISRTITVTMLETQDGAMLFQPAMLNVAKGETVRLSFINQGEMVHEFVMGDTKAIEEHRKKMQAAALEGHAMHHDHHGANALSLMPGATGEIIWQFTTSGLFEFACLIPGHYELGMHGSLKVE